MGEPEEAAKRDDVYRRLFGDKAHLVDSIIGRKEVRLASSRVPGGPVPGDTGFASSVLGSSAPEASMAKPPPGPAPGDPGFGIGQIMASHPAPAKANTPSSPQPMVLPPGAGLIDTSGVAPAGFSAGTVHLGNVPSGAGSIDLSGVTSPGGSPTAPGADRNRADQAAGQPTTQGIYVPGGWQHASRAESRQHGMDPNKLEEGRYYRDVGQGHGLTAADKHLEAAQVQGAADAAYSVAHAQAAQQAAEETKRIENERKVYIAQEHEKLANLSVAAQKQVDPQAARGSTGAQLFAALGVALGQFGASMNGGPNSALQIVNANIDRNIAAQEKNIANAGKAHEREQSLYHQNLEAFGDRDRAVLATKMQMLDQAKAIADQAYASSKSTMNEADYHKTLQGLDDKHAEYADQFAAKTDDKVASESHDAYRPGGMVGGGTAATGEAKKDAHGYSEELEKAGIPAALAGLQDIDQRIDSMGSGDVPGLGYVKDHLPAVLLSKEGAANRQAVQALKNNIGHAKFGGALSPTEAEKLDKELEGAHDAASLRNVVQSFRRSLSNRQKNIQAGFSREGKALYEQRGGSVNDVRTDRATTPYQRPVEDDGK